ncbi:MAG: FmdE family protein [Jatrophihabitantaceae bacterium]
MSTAYSEVARFHGHECPGMTVGLRAAELAVARLGRHSEDNELMATAETISCAVDAIQLITGCTFGKRNLVHLDHGKNAFSFWRRSDGAGIRVSAKPGSAAYRGEEIWQLAEKVEDGTASADEQRRFGELQAARIQRILTAPAEDILLVEELQGELPERSRLQPTAACEGCGDQTSTAILHFHRGRMLCPPCHLDAHGGSLPADHSHHDHSYAANAGHAHGHSHGENGHSHAEHAHAGHSHGEHSHAEHSHAGHSHGEHSHAEHGHGH